MATPASPFMPTEHLNKLARMRSSGAVPEQYRQSLPVPILRDGSTWLAFFYCPSMFLPGKPVQLKAPRFRLTLDPRTGSLVELKAVTAREFGIRDTGDHFIGTFGLPQGMTAADYMAKLARFCTLLDQLLPLYGGPAPSASPSLKRISNELHHLFLELSEPPLHPYYQALGKDFFTWLDRLRL